MWQMYEIITCDECNFDEILTLTLRSDGFSYVFEMIWTLKWFKTSLLNSVAVKTDEILIKWHKTVETSCDYAIK